MSTSLDSAVLELLELSKLDSPFSRYLIDLHRRRLVNDLLNSGKIDAETAEYLKE